MAETKSPTRESKELAERKERFTTISGLPVERLYTEESLAGWDSETALGYPGEFPYTTVTGARYDSGNYQVALSEALRLAGYDALRAEQAARLQEAGDQLSHARGVSPVSGAPARRV